MHEYKIEIERDGRWWMVHIPELDGLTQARRISESEQMACEWIAVSTGTPFADIAVHIVSIIVPGVGDILAQAHHVEDLRRRAELLEAEAADAAKQYARQLAHEGVPVRDAAVLIGVSPQRISQLANVKDRTDEHVPRRVVTRRR
jgi:hypothetical protein